MSRGDQRDRDREKSQAKQQAKMKAQAKSGNPVARNANDAAALQAKVAAKKAKQVEETPTSSGPVPRKKVEKKNESLDDLLSAGLGTAKKGKK